MKGIPILRSAWITRLCVDVLLCGNKQAGLTKGRRK